MEKIVYDFIKNSQKNHWWFIGRKKVIEQILSLYYTAKINDTLDIGSGYGVMVPSLLKYSKNVDAIEPLLEAKPELLKMGIREVFSIISFPGQFIDKQYNLITMFDVLEHIKEDKKALQTIKKHMIKPGGKIILTVPAYQWLWTTHDTANHHYRRYYKNQLKGLLTANGFKKVRVTYFMTFLFPMAFFQRWLSKWNCTSQEFRSINPVINTIFKKVFSSEALWIRYFPYSFGLSLLAVAEA